MISNQWYVILESKEVNKKPIGIKRLNKNLVLFRDKNNKINCLEDKCRHRGVKLSHGKVVNDCIECPFHGFQYAKDGSCQKIPANGKDSRIPKVFNTVAYAVQERSGFIYFFNGAKDKANEELLFFDELDDGFSYSSKKVKWNMHYSRCVENQLDVIHVPFVHSKTIGREYKTLVNGPVVKWDNQKMTFYVFNEIDNGQKPLKPSEIENYEKLFSLQFIMPNIWQNRITDKMRIMVAFAPVDEENTVIYLRYYQKFITIPVLKNIINFLANKFNQKVLKEDHEIVITQTPKKSYLGMEEHLVQGDLPIAEYRKRVWELKEENISE